MRCRLGWIGLLALLSFSLRGLGSLPIVTAGAAFADSADAQEEDDLFGGAPQPAPATPEKPPVQTPPSKTAKPVKPAAEVKSSGQSKLPSKAEQETALKAVKDVYQDDYRRKSAEERLALSRKLLEVALQGGDDAPSRFVMLTEARDIAANAGDASLVIKAVDALVAAFEVKREPMRLDALGLAARQGTDAKRSADVVKALLSIADEAVAIGDLDMALSAVTKAEPASKRCTTDDLSGRVARRSKELKTLKTQYSGLAAAKLKLATSKDDPQANTLVGKYLCLVQGDWTGLENLARCDDPALKKAATLDLESKGAPKSQEEVGDAWAAVSEKLDGTGKERAQQRAVSAYQLALPEQTGLRKLKIEKQIAALHPAPATQPGGDKKTAVSKKGAPQDSILKTFEALVKASPANFRATPDKAGDANEMNKWLSSQKGKFHVEGTLVLRKSYVAGDRGAGPDTAEIYCDDVGPYTLDGLDYKLAFYLLIRDKTLFEGIRSLEPGTPIQVKGSIQQLIVIEGKRPEDTTPVARWSAVMDGPTISVKKPKADGK